MNLLIFEESDFITKNEIFVSAPKAKHLQTVIGAKIGSNIRLGQLNGRIGVGEIKSFMDDDRGGAVIEIKELSKNSAQPELDLVLALPRPQMLKRILENITTFGVRRLYLINSRRVEKSFFSSPVLKPENLKKHLIIGLEQAAVTILPEVEIFSRFRDFTARILTDKHPEEKLKIIAHTTGSVSLAKFASRHKTGFGKSGDIITVAIGPEGGWIDSEAEEFERFGFVQINLGERILRVETAVYALLAQIQVLKAVVVPAQ